MTDQLMRMGELMRADYIRRLEMLRLSHEAIIRHREKSDPENELQMAQGIGAGIDDAINEIRRVHLSDIIDCARAETEIRECINEDCGWRGPRSKCVKYKHDSDDQATFCPECHEVTEIVESGQQEPIELTDKQLVQIAYSLGLGNSKDLLREVGPYDVTEPTHAFRRLAEKILSFAAQPAIPSGCVVVPVEPTDDMLVSGQEAWVCVRHDKKAIEDCAEADQVYRAMIAAAPEPKGE